MKNTLWILVILFLLIISVFGSFDVQAMPGEINFSRAVSQPWRHISSYSGDNIDMLDSNEGWGVLNAGTRAFLYHWNGTTWQKWGEISHSQDIVRSDIEIVSAADGWITLGGPLGQEAETSIYRWNGTNWILFDTLTDPYEISMSKLSMISATDGWALATFAFGSFLYHWNGTTWNKEQTILLSENFIDRDIHMVSSTDGWAIGDSIYRFDGTNWTELDGLPTIDHSLYAIDMVSANDGWIVGEEGTIMHWDGTSWTSVSSPTTIVLTAISMASADHGWAIGGEHGGSNVLIHWDGSSWTEVDCPTDAELKDIFMISEYDGWFTSYWSLTSAHGMFQYNPTSLEINHASGAVGSYLNVTGEGFPPNATTTINVNDEVLSTSLSTDSSGTIQFTLDTNSADLGVYYVSVSVNPKSTARFVLSSDEPEHPLEGSFTLLEIPAGIALQEVYLPLIIN